MASYCNSKDSTIIIVPCRSCDMKATLAGSCLQRNLEGSEFNGKQRQTRKRRKAKQKAQPKPGKTMAGSRNKEAGICRQLRQSLVTLY